MALRAMLVFACLLAVLLLTGCRDDIDNRTPMTDGTPGAAWANSVVGTGVGVALQGTDVYFGGRSDGPAFR